MAMAPDGHHPLGSARCSSVRAVCKIEYREATLTDKGMRAAPLATLANLQSEETWDAEYGVLAVSSLATLALPRLSLRSRKLPSTAASVFISSSEPPA